MAPVSFAGRHAIVTGAASGLGRAIARALRSSGASVTAVDRDKAGLTVAAAEDGTEPVVLDVSDRAAVDSAIAGVATPDILVNAAGLLQRPLPPEAIPPREMDRIVDVNWGGTFHLCAVVGARMAARGGGAIVNIASITGLQPAPVHVYSATKAAIVSLTVSLAAEWGRRGVRVNAVAPGYVETPALEKALHFGVLDAGTLASATALGRLVTVEEIAAVALFLASDAASGITGAVIPVDAGTTALAGRLPFGTAGG